MSRSILLRKAKKNMEGDIQIKVMGETFNFTVYGGCGSMHIHKKMKKMTITDNLKIWFRIAKESRAKL